MSIVNGRLKFRKKISDSIDVAITCLICHAAIQKITSTHVKLMAGRFSFYKEQDDNTVKQVVAPRFATGWVCSHCVSQVDPSEVIHDRADHNKEPTWADHSRLGFGMREPEPNEKPNLDWMRGDHRGSYRGKE